MIGELKVPRNTEIFIQQHCSKRITRRCNEVKLPPSNNDPGHYSLEKRNLVFYKIMTLVKNNAPLPLDAVQGHI